MKNKSITVITKSSKETSDVAKKLAKEISKKKSAVVLGLEGELGGGKTTFVQAFGKALGVKEKILSPTFLIFKKFAISQAYGKHFYHFDCYRIKSSKELLELGFEEIISNPQNIVAIEWADNIKKIMPKNTIWINFKFINETTRKIIFDI